MYTVVVTMNKIWASFMDNYGTHRHAPGAYLEQDETRRRSTAPT